MNGIGIIILIILGIITLSIFWKIVKPYFIKYDTTLLLTGGLGSGKTLTAVKQAVICLRKKRIKVWWLNHVQIPWKNFKTKIKNKKIEKFNKKVPYLNTKIRLYNEKHTKKKDYVNCLDLKPLIEKRKKPLLYSNIPINFKKSMWRKDREWAVELTKEMLTCFEQIREFSVVVIDEFPQIVNQYNWNLQEVQDNLNELITFFRHYVDGHLIITAQATDDVVAQVRRKLNQAVWCFDFHAYKFLWIPLFYTTRMCDVMMNDDMSTFTTSYIEENTKKHYGLFPPKDTYDTRCYSERYKNSLIIKDKNKRFKDIKTNKIIKIKPYISPLDDNIDKKEKEKMLKNMNERINKQ